jgi:hypothetical protein
MADRFARQFLRLQKAYRDQRRLFGTLVVAAGQVNIAGEGGQQVVATRTIRAAPASRTRARTMRRRTQRAQRIARDPRAAAAHETAFPRPGQTR